jgi:ACR3 family arsenite efflux pump ArsB
LAVIVRHIAYSYGGQAAVEQVIKIFKPVTTVGLLATLVLIFIYQGRTIGDKPLHIVLIAIPLCIQTFAIFGLTYLIGYSFSPSPNLRTNPRTINQLY